MMQAAQADTGGLVWVDWREGVLSLGYHWGEAYDYFGVPQFVYSELMQARSKRGFIDRIVKRRFLSLRRSS